MEHKKLSSGAKIPSLGLGTWGIGGTFKKDSSREKEEIALIKDAISLGYTHIDTAELYGEGQTEKEIGIAIRGMDRSSLFLTTKVWKANLAHNDVIQSCEKSLKRMQADYADLYLIHWPNADIPLKETMGAMEELAGKGAVRHIGVSNFSVREMQEAQSHLKNSRIAANQVEYSLLIRDAEEGIIPYCQKNNIMVIAYRPLAKGNPVLLENKGLKDIAKKYQKTPAQLALKWVISQKKVIAIAKAGSPAHLKENLGVFGWELGKKDLDRIGNIHFL